MQENSASPKRSWSETLDWVFSAPLTEEELTRADARLAQMDKESDERKRAFEAGETEGESIVVFRR